jgi:outer membrane protein OmpA-like peptidoglycan-associated protein
MNKYLSTLLFLASAPIMASPSDSSYCGNAGFEMNHSVSTGKVVGLAQYRQGALQLEQGTQPPYAKTVILPASELLAKNSDCDSYVNTGSINEGKVASINFGFDQATLSPMARDSLHKLAQSIGTDHQILIEGHTDNIGTKDYNQALGLQRALTVYDLMRYQGVGKQHITVRTHGETKPLEPNTSSEYRAMNRRAEIIVVGNE